jgi:hypothetical protein
LPICGIGRLGACAVGLDPLGRVAHALNSASKINSPKIRS